MIFDAKDRVLFIGDSVSDFGRARPVGEGLHDGVGTGFIRVISNFINGYYPERNIRITNMGISGNNVLDLDDRWQSDVLDLEPDWVNILIGINDVWRQFDTPDCCARDCITPEIYERTYRELLDRTVPYVKGVTLMTPYYMEPLKEDMMRKRMDEYVAAVKRIAKDYGFICIDLQRVFDEYLKVRHSSYLTWDRVHPNGTGATLIAMEFLKEVGFDFSRLSRALSQ